MFTQTSTHKKIKILMSELGVIDLWRDVHPTERDYTHYSNPHDVYSRIDYIFIFKRDRHRVHQCEHGNIDLSDHAPILLTIQISNNPRNTLWKLNSSILNDQQFKTQIKKELEQFLQENNNEKVPSEIVWDTLKAVVRGKIISYCANKNKKRQEKLAELTKELEELETKNKKDTNPNIALQLKEIRKEINTWYTQETQKKMLFTKQKYYETGAKLRENYKNRKQIPLYTK